MRSPHVNVTVDLTRVRAAAEAIRTKTGVRVIAVIKADAYGLGAQRVATALEPVVDEFAYFALHEARQVGKPGIILGPASGTVDEHVALGVRPFINSVAQAREFAAAHPILSVDTGMQRFGCRPEDVDAVLATGLIREAATHTTSLKGVELLNARCAGRVETLHAACTALLDEPRAWLSAVRAGVGLYVGALRVTTPLFAVHETHGPIGYTGFDAARVGVILAGYSNGLVPASVLIKGREQRILEVGMNSSFVSVDAGDQVGDEVVLLGGKLSESRLGNELSTRPHEILCRYASMGPREYIEAG